MQRESQSRDQTGQGRRGGRDWGPVISHTIMADDADHDASPEGSRELNDTQTAAGELDESRQRSTSSPAPAGDLIPPPDYSLINVVGTIVRHYAIYAWF